MGGGYFVNAGVFLVETLFGLYIFAVMLRFILQVVRADFYNPLSQAIVTVTNPALRPLRRYIPAYRNLDTASIVLMVGLQLICTTLVALLVGIGLSPPGLLVMAVAGLLEKSVYLFIFAVIVRIVLSWVAPGTYNPVIGMIDSITDPLLRPARRILPPFGGALDLSPMLVIIGLYLALMLVVAPLRDLGRAWM